MRWSTRAILMAVAVCAAVACNKNGGGKDNLQTVDGPVGEEEAGDVISESVCTAYENCRCGELAGVSLTGCETGLRFSWTAREEDATQMGLTYDGDCVARRINAMADRGCDLPDRTTVPFCTGETCLVWHGDKQEGEECEGGQSTSDCAQGLVCLGTCQKPCANTGVDIAEGEVCRDEEIDFYGLCAEGLICEPESGLCTAYPQVGEACLQGSICADGLWCDPTDAQNPVCAEKIAVDDECTYAQSCESFSCTDATCDPIPGEGEACVQICAEGLVCGFEDNERTCVKPPGVGEACLTTVNPRCADGLTCRDGTCAVRPGPGESCEPGADGIPPECTEGFICSAKLCSLTPDAAGCDECPPDDDSCTVRVCAEIPPAVCGDSGGLLY